MKDLSPIIVALDSSSAAQAYDLLSKLDPKQCRVKVGFESFVAFGPRFVEEIQLRGFEVFLDLKFHDIPNTVAGGCRSAAQLGVWMLTIHASGGQRMIAAAREALDGVTGAAPQLIAVTVLTSMADEDLRGVGIETSAQEQVLNLANLAKLSGADGVVCSAQEAGSIRKRVGSDFTLVTPGIRLASTKLKDDQRRTMTPKAAMDAGSNYLVVGRPITQATDPMSVLSEILVSLDE